MGVLRGGEMDLYARLSDKSLLKLYRIARHCGDFVRANEIAGITVPGYRAD